MWCNSHDCISIQIFLIVNGARGITSRVYQLHSNGALGMHIDGTKSFPRSLHSQWTSGMRLRPNPVIRCINCLHEGACELNTKTNLYCIVNWLVQTQNIRSRKRNRKRKTPKFVPKNRFLLRLNRRWCGFLNSRCGFGVLFCRRSFHHSVSQIFS